MLPTGACNMLRNARLHATLMLMTPGVVKKRARDRFRPGLFGLSLR